MKKNVLLLFILIVTSCWYELSAQTNEVYQLSTHILDINQGKPASDVSITLFKRDMQSGEFEKVASGKTDINGRIANFLPSNQNNAGIYKLRFETFNYFAQQNIPSIYPYIEVVFQLEGSGHYHIPITVSANGYSTYRGN